MVARWYHADINGDFTEITDRVSRVGWEIREQAEEGSAAMSTVTFDDPDMDWAPEPWRNWYVLEDTSEDANSMLCGGWTAEQEVGREGGEWTQPLGRVWTMGHTDANTYWSMRVMVGADANRPAETDVERMQWLLATNEVAWALDVTTYVQTTSPIDMDACDYRGQYLNQIMDDCAQASGRNWYAWIDYLYDVRTVTVWYGKDTWAVRDSALFLTNDPTELVEADLEDGTSLFWPISQDTKLKRDPSRMYDGVYLTYDGGAVYRDTDPRTVRRDHISPSSNVKSSAKAIARATRYLADLDEQDEVITTSVELPAAKATMIRAGMRLQFRATHLPGYDVYRWLRVLSCSVTPIAAGTRYRLTLELTPVSAVEPGLVFAGLQASLDYPELGWNNNMDDHDAGWHYYPTTGPISYDQSTPPYNSMTVSEDMTVRVMAACYVVGTSVGWTRTLSVKVNGTEIGSDTNPPSPGGFQVYLLEVDVRDVELSAGDVVSAEGDVDYAWINYTTNQTFVYVVRGSFLWQGETTGLTGP